MSIICSIAFGADTPTSNGLPLTVLGILTALFFLKLEQVLKKFRNGLVTRIFKQPWIFTPTLHKMQRMKWPINSHPTLVFKIWVPKWVPKKAPGSLRGLLSYHYFLRPAMSLFTVSSSSLSTFDLVWKLSKVFCDTWICGTPCFQNASGSLASSRA